MSVWLCLPSARPDGGTIHRWRAAGYRIAVWRDPGAQMIEADILMHGTYPGYYAATTRLMRMVFDADRQCNWCVAAGDDTWPAHEAPPYVIESICPCVFGGSTFGVMQPIGDPWSDHMGKIIERIAGSPWIGREFFRCMYGGTGPWWHEYTHCFGDEELQCVAKKLGVFLQRADLTQYHENWARKRGSIEDRPAFLAEANSSAHWVKYQSIFLMRKAAGFPGHEPIP